MATPNTQPQDRTSSLDQVNDELDQMLAEAQSSSAQAPGAQNPPSTMPAQVPPEEVPSAEASPTTSKKEGFLSKAASVVGNTLAGIGVGLARVPGQTAGAAADLAKDVYDVTGINDAQRNFGEWLMKGPERFPGQKNIGAGLLADPMLDRKANFADKLSARKYLGTVGYDALNQGTAEIGSLVLGTAGLSEVRLAAGLAKYVPKTAKVLDLAGQAGIAAFGLMDPHAARVSTIMKNLGVDTEFTNWLAGDDKDGALGGRFKNALEGAGLGAAFESVFLGSKYLYALAKGGPEAAAAAKVEAQAAAKEVIPDVAHPQDTVVAKAADGTITANGEPVVKFAKAEDYEELLRASRMDEPGGALAQATEDAPGGMLDAKVTYANPTNSAPMPPLNDPSRIAPMLRQLAIDLHDTPHVVKTDAEMYTKAEMIARDIGVDPGDLLMAAENVAGKMADIDSAVTAMRGGWYKVASDVEPWAARGINSISDSDMPALKTAIHNAVTYSGYFAQVRSQSGRLLRSLGLDDVEQYLAKGDKDAVTGPFAAEPIKPLPQTRQELGDWLEMWNDTKNNPALRQDFLQGAATVPSAFKYFRTSMANWFTASALSGLPSLTMNTVGPAVLGVLHTTEKTLGGAVAAMLERDPGKRAELIATSANAARAYAQTMGDIPNVLKYAAQAFQSNRGVLGGGGTVNDIVSNMGPITPAMIRSAQGQDAPVWGYALGNAVNFLPRQFQRLNAGMDEFAKRLSYNGEVRLQAQIEAGKLGLSGDAMRTYVKRSMQEAIEQSGPNVGAATDETLLRSAERTTLTGSLTGNDYAPNVGRFANAINSLRRDVPEFRYIAPVFNVPANSVGETLRRIPGLNLMLGETRDELLGNLGAVRQADAYGRTMMGGMFMLMGYSLARNGQLTGAGPQDPRDRKIWELNHQPYSVKIGDHWVSYARFDLPGSLLAIPATMYDKTVNRNSDQDWTMAMLGGAGTLAQYFKDKAALQGVSQMMDFGAAPSSDLNYVERVVGNTAARMAVPNFVTQLGRNVIDPERRQRASIGDYIVDALPWASKELDPVRNVLGEPQFKPNQTLLENGLPITISSTRPNDKVVTELNRLYEATGYGGGVTTPGEISGGSPANGYYDPRNVTLEDGRSMYDAVMRKRAQPNDNLEASSVRAKLAELFESEDYQNATDGDATSMFDSEGNVSKAALVKQVYSDYNKEAIRSVAAESPIAKRYLAVSAAKKINGEALRPYSVQRLVDTPDLLKALNINIEDFEDKLQ